MEFFTKDNRTALEAKSLAQFIAFGPVLFQVARVLRNSGILQHVDASGSAGLPIEALIERTGLSRYGIRVLLESGLGIGLLIKQGDHYVITRTGYFILQDPLTCTNMDFVHDVCYKGLFSLDESIEQGRPVGLKEFGNWSTIYEGLSQLPASVQKSWFQFDHFFSDMAFPLVLPLVYGKGVRKLLDVGGNTGKWAIASAAHHPEVQVTIMDLPGQLEVARQRIRELGLSDRIFFHAVNILDATQPFPKGFPAIWMSQFLDCFSEEEIVSILKRCYEAMEQEAELLILEAFWDLQRFEAAAFCLQQTSIYFTALANGNSQMYHSGVFKACLEQSGFSIVEQTDHIGLSHTLLRCKKK
jgi:ubiquinone/menaquinone biosynthesis C-methylase UbiE